VVLASKIRKRELLMRSFELVVLVGTARLPFLRRTHAPDEQVDFPVQDVSDMGHEGHRICDVLRSLPLVEQPGDDKALVGVAAQLLEETQYLFRAHHSRTAI
jgi:hypothetical protein